MNEAGTVEVTPANVEQILAERGCLDPDALDRRLSGKPQFVDNLDCAKTEPTFSGVADFPFDEVCRNVDGDAEGQRQEVEMSAVDAWKALEALKLWVLESKAQDQRAVKSIGIKFIAAAWVMNPAIFGDVPAHMVAKSFGIAHQSFKTKTADFSRVFKVQNRFQVHDWQNDRQQIIAP